MQNATKMNQLKDKRKYEIDQFDVLPNMNFPYNNGSISTPYFDMFSSAIKIFEIDYKSKNNEIKFKFKN